ncbi:MAG TPA: hypothetical protein VHE30_25320 [Polyangiaceae bacterium]|nr:hypothetical protein [Polyangiaceae bacterium]
MRLALLGPAEGRTDALEAAAHYVLSARNVDRAVYLGVDGALDALIGRLASELVGENPSAEAVWGRSVRACLHADSGTIDRYLEAERQRAALRLFESLPDAETRAVEMLGGALILMIHDKAQLNEEDMLPARLLLFGKSKTPVIKQVGQRWFLSPGELGDAGLMLLDDDDDGILLTQCDARGTVLRQERLAMSRGTKLRVGAG